MNYFGLALVSYEVFSKDENYQIQTTTKKIKKKKKKKS